MADFCRHCSIAIFGQDSGDLAGLTTAEDMARGLYAGALCEGCGVYILVDPDGAPVYADLPMDDGMCRSCVGDKCVTGPECVALGLDGKEGV
jgi:hypothetical protein